MAPTGVRVALPAFLTACLATAVAAQTPINEPPDYPVRFGPLYLRPLVAISEAGLDTNVFHEAEDPQEDFTATIVTRLDAALLMGPLRLSGLTGSDYVWYQELRDERSINAMSGGRVDLFLNRLQPFVGAQYQDTRARPSLEIDARARRTLRVGRAGANVRVGVRTAVGVEAVRDETEFDVTETFRGVNLAGALNRTSERIVTSARLEATPLTTFVLGADYQEDRFLLSDVRNSDSVRLTGGFEFDPLALLAGRVIVGWRRFAPADEDVTSFTGFVSNLQLAYALLGTTRFTVRLDRDVAYSIDDRAPYYVQTGIGLEVVQRMGGSFDVVVRGARERLAYRGRSDAEEPPGVATVDGFGGGLGVRIGETGRVGLDFERSKRRSTTEADQRYDRDRIFVSLTYGL